MATRQRKQTKKKGVVSTLKKTLRSFQLGGDPDLTARQRFRITVADLERVTARVNNRGGSGVDRAALRGVMIRLRRQRKALQEEITRERTRAIRARQKPKHT